VANNIEIEPTDRAAALLFRSATERGVTVTEIVNELAELLVQRQILDDLRDGTITSYKTEAPDMLTRVVTIKIRGVRKLMYQLMS
jgi:hypothetical protein